jgi:hypothetical protein
MIAPEVEAPELVETAQRPAPRTWVRIAEVVGLVAVTVVAFLVRRGGLPHDGLWYDDAWVAVGAIHGRLSDLMTVGSGHPAFTALLMGWHRVDPNVQSLAIPALVAGTLTPALLYLALRDARYQRSISALLAAAVAVAWVDIRYSTRVKPYTFDPVLILCLGLVLHRLVRRRWTWATAAFWTVTAIAFGFFSGFLLLATAAAGIVLFLHPVQDRAKRAAAVAAQAACELALFGWARRSTNLPAIEDDVQRLYDAHLTFHANPITFGSEIVTHLRHIAEVYPGGSGIWLTLFAFAAVAGLAVAALRPGRGAERIWCRYLGLMLLGSFVGALAGKFPFGPVVASRWSSGGRYMLWVTPVVAFGLAAVLQRASQQLRRRHAPRWAIRGAVGVAAVIVLLTGIRSPVPYHYGGSETAARYVDAVRQPGDVVIVTPADLYSFSASTDLPVTLRPTPSQMIGFTPVLGGANVHDLFGYGGASGLRRLRDLTQHAGRVIMVMGGDPDDSWSRPATTTLRSEGFRVEQHRFGSRSVLVASR